MAVPATPATVAWGLHPNLIAPKHPPCLLQPPALTVPLLFHLLSTLLRLPSLPPPAAYIMTALAGLLQAGLMRAKAKAEAHEAFTLTPLLIGGRTAALCASGIAGCSRGLLLARHCSAHATTAS